MLLVATTWPFAVTVRLVIGLVLVAAGASKLSNIRAFAELVAQYRVLPPVAAPFLGYSIPLIELLLGVAILLGIGQPWVSLSACLLFLAFSVAVVVNLLRRRVGLPCGCMGSRYGGKVSRSVVYRNLALAAAASYSTLPSLSDAQEDLTGTEIMFPLLACVVGAMLSLLVLNAARRLLVPHAQPRAHSSLTRRQ
jgi:uncharacterized membrane protein YphA (DoxX/SURF4 family)